MPQYLVQPAILTVLGEIMVANLVAAGSWLAITVHSFVVWRTMKPIARVPMQWGFDGKPTWYASPAVALAFLPIISALVLMVIYRSRSVDDVHDGKMIPAALIFLAIHLLFTWKLTRP